MSLDFAEFVEKEYGNDPFRMVDAFCADIATEAAKASVDWDRSRENVPIQHGTKVSKATYIKSLDKEYIGRVFINVGIYEFDFTRRRRKSVFDGGGVKEELVRVPFPYLYFGNFSESVANTHWSGINSLWDEFYRYRSGNSVKKSTKSNAALEAIQLRSEKSQQEIAKIQTEASAKDIAWMRKLDKTNDPGKYFLYKGALNLAEQIKLYSGTTQKGIAVGEFRGVPVIDGGTGKVKGMQRYYASDSGKKAQKVFRRGFNPMGCLVPFGLFCDGAPIYIGEQVATASIINRLTGMAAVSYLFVDNGCSVVHVLKSRYPNSPIINVRDDDVTKKVNAGQKMQKKLESSFEGIIVDHPPLFTKEEALDGNSDLSDFWLLRGEDKTRQFLLDIHR